MANHDSTTTKPDQTTSTTERTSQQAKEMADKATQQAKDVAARAKEGARQGANQAANEASKMANELGSEVKQMASTAAHQAEERVNEQKGYAADRLAGVATALRETGNNFRSQEEETFANYANGAAEQIERFSGYLREQNMNDLLRDVQQMAKRQPEIFVAGALAAGFFLGRFFKSSGQSQLPTQYRGGYPGRYTEGVPGGSRPASDQYGYSSYNRQSNRYGEQYGEQYSGRSQSYGNQAQGSSQYGDERYRTQDNQGTYASSYGATYGTGTSTAGASTTGASTTGASTTGAYSSGSEATSAQQRAGSNVQHQPHTYAAASTITKEESADSSNEQQKDSSKKHENDHDQTRKEN